ncbi:hypothetical protein [Helicobacter sp. MIT 01-3238]|uniref:hypothetical protein n=1 Tax=Helicobacter sp. MIT 01-3238 TaxID=398627 RepID=UPI0011C02938|nr:hypothetical protein [Helicobacter sp. MIT 01-3238]
MTKSSRGNLCLFYGLLCSLRSLAMTIDSMDLWIATIPHFRAESRNDDSWDCFVRLCDSPRNDGVRRGGLLQIC